MRLRDLRLFLTTEYDCSYLPKRQARNLVADPKLISQTLYDQLISHGFRRSGDHIYRPHCYSCNACRSLRLPSHGLQLNRSQRRCWRNNQDLRLRWRAAGFNAEHYALFKRYVKTRHVDGGMDDTSEEGYRSFLISDWCDTRLAEWWSADERRLLAVAVVDWLHDGLSAVYTFFDTSDALRTRGLGSYAILSLLSEAQAHGLPWLYLGYWVRGCEKMDYKARFKPHQVFRNGSWYWNAG